MSTADHIRELTDEMARLRATLEMADKWVFEAAALARRQAISECAALMDADAKALQHESNRDLALQHADMLRALLTRPEEARGGDGEKA